MIRWGRIALAAAVALPAFGAVAGGVYVVDQSNRRFSVRELHVRRGETVRFNNVDEFSHHIYVASPGFNFNSGEQRPGQTVDVPFAVPGGYEVLCEIHPKMLLKVSVD